MRHRIGGTSLTAFVCVVVAGLAGSGISASAGDRVSAEGGLTFLSRGVIWSVRLDGSGLRRVTWGVRGGYVDLSCAPDGRRLVVLKSVQAGPDELVLVDPRGAERRVLFSTASLAGPAMRVGLLDPAWSPDGTRIAFVLGRGLFDDEVDVISVKDGPRWRVADGRFPAWSPDGQILYFERSDADGILKVQAGGGPVSTVLTVGSMSAVSPDGRQLAFVDHAGNIKIANATSGRIETTVLHADRIYRYQRPSWSPDGRYIVAVKAQDEHLPLDTPLDRTSIVVVHPDGTGKHTVVVRKNPIEVSWQPKPR
jgi:Tol biopolymer transport system component